MSTANESEKQKPSFALSGIYAGYKIKPRDYPKLEVYVPTYWFGSEYPLPNADTLKKGIITAIEQAFGARCIGSSLPVSRVEVE